MNHFKIWRNGLNFNKHPERKFTGLVEVLGGRLVVLWNFYRSEYIFYGELKHATHGSIYLKS